MPVLQWGLIAVAAILVVNVLFFARGDRNKVIHTLADASFFAFVGYATMGKLPPDKVLIIGVALVGILLVVSGILYRAEGKGTSAVLAFLVCIAMVCSLIAHYAGLI